MLYEWNIQVPVIEASGHQLFRVMAESEEEALRIVEDKGDFVSEEIQAVTLDYRNAEFLPPSL